ncbi:glycosyltransferase family 2 protein [Desulfoglaeba alkanexedens]|uniref:Glycosyltransferase family 2 protein n=1 Tax=Desulfoglaeba alkanexedens ALDC TaxID=980445 RepID=A0A4V1ERE6_9BACT|nr:glycosyltransferase family 2 protein [Desulfoglaeba alkanexedens]QCQ21371.1 glycosyltransferase family 2 protein [Desulfoglaeba alkanexedens ALDC]
MVVKGDGTAVWGDARVAVLISTYNGADYIREQLESVFAQSHPAERVLVRDDGSRDETLEILAQFQRRHENLRVLRGGHAGVAASYFALLAEAGDSPDYFAFGDQDDVWRPSRIGDAVKALESVGGDAPRLYFSRVEYVDRRLRPLGRSPVPVHVGFRNALVENPAIGCTQVLDRGARELLLNRLPRSAWMHDWWTYLVISALGRVVYDRRPNVCYRLHGGNAVGGRRRFFPSLTARAGRLARRSDGIFLARRQAMEFLERFGDLLSRDERATATRFVESKADFRSRLEYALRMDLRRNDSVDQVLLRLLVLANWY